MRAGVAEGGLFSPVFFSQYVNDVPSPSHHVELALYADTAVSAMARKPTLLANYLEAYLNALQKRLNEWRMAINVYKSTAIIFGRAPGASFNPDQ
jgi:hypothetical protein